MNDVFFCEGMSDGERWFEKTSVTRRNCKVNTFPVNWDCTLGSPFMTPINQQITKIQKSQISCSTSTSHPCHGTAYIGPQISSHTDTPHTAQCTDPPPTLTHRSYSYSLLLLQVPSIHPRDFPSLTSSTFNHWPFRTPAQSQTAQ
jgi:hypothetical protein